MGHKRWRLIVDEPMSGAKNMARDEALANSPDEIPTLRAYRFDPAAITIGRSQSIERILSSGGFREKGVDLVKRPTGGLAILHRGDYTYSVTAPLNGFGKREARELYFDRIASSIITALRLFAIDAEQARHGARSPSGGTWCFNSAFGIDIEWQGRKICGSAQRVYDRMVLQHGTLFLGSEEEVLPGMATVAEASGRGVSWDAMLEAFSVGFSETLGIELVRGEYSPAEEELFRRLYTDKYSLPGWSLTA